MNYLIAPSLLSADWARLGEEAQAVIKAGADLLHLDVMDNHYVPNLTVGPLACAALRRYGVEAPIDVHLMVQPVDRLIEAFADAGATSISFHPEASSDFVKSLNLISSRGCQAGLAINPATSLACLEPLNENLDFILMMSVNPGFAGQSFIATVMDKIKKTRELIQMSGRDLRLYVDGGVKRENIREIAAAGADSFVLGSGIFKEKDYAKTIADLRAELGKVNHD